jgi:F-type H+-transporting ATPase subunit c
MRHAALLMLFLVVVAGLTALPVFAQGVEGGEEARTMALPQGLVITAGFAMALAAAGCGYAQSKALTAGCEGVSRNPGAADTIRFFIILGLAFIEFLALLTFVVVAILLFTPKFWPVA